MRVRLVQKSMPLDDLELPFRILFQNACDFGAHHENLYEDRPNRNNSRGLLGDDRRDVKRQWGNRKRRFLGLSDATSSAP